MSWAGLPAPLQDALAFIAALAPLALVAAWLLPRHQPWPLARALLRRHWGVSLTFLILIALSTAAGAALLASERGLREASARATDPFDVVVAAPGSETTALLASVFLRPADVALLDGDALAKVLADERVAMAAPIAFGDSAGDAPIVGTVEALPHHLAGEIEGRMWSGPFEAIVGAALPYAIGSRIEPAHGHGEGAEEDAHGQELVVVGRMARTGTPWDGAVLSPLEGVWMLHGLGDGKALGSGPLGARLGPPYDTSAMPGVPAVLVRATGLGAAYSFRATHQRDGETMAFLPGAELARLHALMGDVREALTLSAYVALALVAAAVLAGLVIVARLFRRQLALLSALGAPRRFGIAVLWLHAALHLVPGALLGLVLGWLGSVPASAIVSARTGLSVSASPGAEEALAVAAFVGAAALAALLPALAAPFGKPLRDLR